MNITFEGRAIEITPADLVQLVALNTGNEDLVGLLRGLAQESRYDEVFRLWEVFRAKERAYAKLADLAGAKLERMTGEARAS